jgi:hypothetical protein
MAVREDSASRSAQAAAARSSPDNMTTSAGVEID